MEQRGGRQRSNDYGASGSAALNHSMVKERIEQLHAKFSTPYSAGGYRGGASGFQSRHASLSEPSSEVVCLREEVQKLQRELRQAKRAISNLEEREQLLKDRLSEQAKKQLEKSGKFEDLSLGENRPTQLIQRYKNLYSQTRLDALDALEELPEISEYEELKGKLIFSIIVLSFRSISNRLYQVRSQLQDVLSGGSPEGVSGEDVRGVEHSVLQHMRRNVDKYDLSHDVQEVCELVWTTLYDFPCLQHCAGLKSYIMESVQLAWALSVQNPPILLFHEMGPFRADMYDRFHSSDPDSEEVKLVVWPALMEDDTGDCLCKGVVIT